MIVTPTNGALFARPNDSGKTGSANFDVFFITDQTMGPNAYVWGYLAARKDVK